MQAAFKGTILLGCPEKRKETGKHGKVGVKREEERTSEKSQEEGNDNGTERETLYPRGEKAQNGKQKKNKMKETESGYPTQLQRTIWLPLTTRIDHTVSLFL